MDIPTRAQLKKNKVVELRAKLSQLGLPQGGVKDDLITRLINHYQEAKLQEEAENEELEVVQEEAINEELDVVVQEEEELDVQEKTVNEELVVVVQEEVVKEELDVQEKAVNEELDVVVQEEVVKEELDVQEKAVNEELVVVIEEARKEESDVEVSEIKHEDDLSAEQQTDIQEAPSEIEQLAVPQEITSVTEPSDPLTTPNVAPPPASNIAPETLVEDEAMDTGMEGVEEGLGGETISQSSPVHVLQSVSIDTDKPPMDETSTEEPAMDIAVDVEQVPPPLADLDPAPHQPLIDHSVDLGRQDEVAQDIVSATPEVTAQVDEDPTTAQTDDPSLVEAPMSNFTSNADMAISATVTAQITSDYYSATDSPKEDTVNKEVDQQGGTLSKAPGAVDKSHLEVEKPSQSEAPTGEKGKKKKKKKRRRRKHDQSQTAVAVDTSNENDKQVQIEYVQEDILTPDDPNYRQFHKIFEAFKLTDPPDPKTDKDSYMPSVSELVAKAAEASKRLAAQKRQQESDDDDDDEDEKDKEAVTISKKKLRKLNRLTVAQLKQLVDRPDVVEMHDVTAHDPKLLIHLKSARNTVPVPRHWCFKRKYLQGKRGIEKPPFNLPDFIKATGVMEMRQAVEEKEDAKSLKQKTRERVRPKMGKLTIDYQKLHDAFFKWQTKPKMSIHGDLYYEGKEFETRLKQKKPGDLSDELRRALGMPVGQGKQKFPPPWLVAMQRYGPPPSYPHLKIPGLNAPIPEGCSFGYFVGGWGKPPVDEMGRPLYGDVFGLEGQELGMVSITDDDIIDKTPWGELESEEEEESEEESDDEAQSPKPEDIQAGLVTPLEGLVTPSGLTSIPAGLETPEMIQLRKKKIEEAMEQGGETPALYTVLPEKAAAIGGAMMGSAHVYDIGAAVPGATKKTAGSTVDGVEVALDPSELDLDTATMSARYEEQLKEQNVLQKEDLSDMVAEHAARQKKRKRTAADSGGGKATKKLKEFKF